VKIVPIALVALSLLVGCSNPTGGKVFVERSTDRQDKKPLSKEVRALLERTEKGDAEAQFKLGAMYNDGRGVTKNVNESLKWYHKSADQGYVKAQNVLGWMYGQGLGVPVDHEEAIRWLRKAEKQGSVVARVALGTYRLKPLLDKALPDKPMPIKFYREFAEQGNAAAQHRLGIMYCDGRGTSKDSVRGYAWLSIAASNGHVSSRKKKETLAKKMTKEQIAEAQKMSRELLKKIAPLPKK
jgi:uncharacterized protein